MMEDNGGDGNDEFKNSGIFDFEMINMQRQKMKHHIQRQNYCTIRKKYNVTIGDDILSLLDTCQEMWTLKTNIMTLFIHRTQKMNINISKMNAKQWWDDTRYLFCNFLLVCLRNQLHD